MMKLFALLLVISQCLVAPVLGTDEKDYKELRGTTTIRDEDSGNNKAFFDEVTPDILEKFGIKIEGDSAGLEGLSAQFYDIDYAMREKEEKGKQSGATITITKGSDSFVPPDTKVQDLELSKDAIDFDSSDNQSAGLPYFQSCKDIYGFGYANNAAIYLSTFWFKVKFDCREKCCAREWKCNGNTCRLSCGFYTITINPFSFFSCCRIYGRTVNPFPYGVCANRFLCSAN